MSVEIEDEFLFNRETVERVSQEGLHMGLPYQGRSSFLQEIYTDRVEGDEDRHRCRAHGVRKRCNESHCLKKYTIERKNAKNMMQGELSMRLVDPPATVPQSPWRITKHHSP